MNYELTVHARESLNKRRNIRLEWLERVIDRPQLIEADAMDSDLEHRLGKSTNLKDGFCGSLSVPMLNHSA